MGTSNELNKQTVVPGPTRQYEHLRDAALKGSAPVSQVHTVAAWQHWQPHYRGMANELTKQLVYFGLTRPCERSELAALKGSSAVEPVHTTGLIPSLGRLLRRNK